MRVLVACEFSGVVRDAFRAEGHEAYSCDLVPDLAGSEYHIQRDVLGVMRAVKWDLMIAHPPCTYLSYAGAHLFPKRRVEQAEALAFVRALMAAPIERIALENPRGVISKEIRRADQVIQPWEYGHIESKETHLWLTNLPYLRPTCVVDKSCRMTGAMTAMSPHDERGRMRSVTFPGMALAMARQWGGHA